MTATSSLSKEEYLGNHLLEISNLVEVKIGHELNLINHRISWLAASQSFLFVAVATLFATHSGQGHDAIFWFIFYIPLMGIILCIVVLVAVNAALKVLANDLLPERAALVAEIKNLSGANLAPLGPDRLTNFFGAIPAIWIPSVFIFSWVVVLVLLGWMSMRP
jgi:hypothetical protein